MTIADYAVLIVLVILVLLLWRGIQFIVLWLTESHDYENETGQAWRDAARTGKMSGKARVGKADNGNTFFFMEKTDDK